MKIYTLTFQFANNYGAILQAYALYNYLKKCGHNVQIIDYWPEYAKNNCYWYSNCTKTYKNILLIPSRIIDSINFYHFLHKHFSVTSRCYDVDDIKSLPNADAVIVGSDQIWNPILLGEINDAYFLNFELNCIKISYAASVGEDNLDNKIISSILPLIKKFDYLSVRELNLFELLKNNGINNIDFVLDPVFLLNVSDYRKLEKKRSYKKYVLVYYNDENKITEKIAKKIAMERGCFVLKVGSHICKKGIRGTKNTKIEEFLWLIDNSEFVVTPSFHGIAFSIIFKKNFYAINNGCRSSRLFSLLNSLNLQNRFITKETNIDSIKIEDTIYNEVVKNKLNELIKKSKIYISKSLND